MSVKYERKEIKFLLDDYGPFSSFLYSLSNSSYSVTQAINNK